MSKVADDLPEEFVCPITKKIMEDPVMDKQGHTFSRDAILAYLKTSSECPVGHETITLSDLAPNLLIKSLVDKWVRKHKEATERKELWNLIRKTQENIKSAIEFKIVHEKEKIEIKDAISAIEPVLQKLEEKKQKLKKKIDDITTQMKGLSEEKERLTKRLNEQCSAFEKVKLDVKTIGEKIEDLSKRCKDDDFIQLQKEYNLLKSDLDNKLGSEEESVKKEKSSEPVQVQQHEKLNPIKNLPISQLLEKQFKKQDIPPEVPKTKPYKQKKNYIGKCIARYDYDAADDCELTLREGDIILVLERHDDGWCLGEKESDGKTVLFPGNYTEDID